MIYNLGLTLGLTVSDIDRMTAGEIFDLAFYKTNQMKKRNEEPEAKKATQADYDNF